MTSLNNRLNTLKLGLEAYRERPVLGWGHENFRSAWGRYVTAEQYSGRIVDQAHNKALDTLVSTGTAGFFVYTVLWLALALTALRLALAHDGLGTPVLPGNGCGARRLLRHKPVHVRYAIVHVVVRHSRWILRVPGAWRRGPDFGAWPRPFWSPDGQDRKILEIVVTPCHWRRRLWASPSSSAWCSSTSGPFMGAQLFVPHGTWPEILDSARESYEAFPALSQTRRTEMMVNTTNVMAESARERTGTGHRGDRQRV